MTTNKKLIQVMLISIGLFLIITTYFLYPKIGDDKLKGSVVQDDIADAIDEEKKGSKFENIEYRGFYDVDKLFTILSKKARVSSEEPDIVYMDDIKAIINLNDGRTITITSEEGIYNKITYNCFFKGNVKATDGEIEILSENLDLFATKDYASIYNNVNVTSKSGSLRADKVDYNFEAKYYKVSMFHDGKVKIKLIK